MAAGSDTNAEERWDALWAKLGPDYGRSTTDPFGDCIHLLAPGERNTTLCGHRVDSVAHASSLDSGFKPDGGSGCWTCLSESNRWAEPSPSVGPGGPR